MDTIDRTNPANLIDNGRIRMENYKGILYCEAYMDDEFTVEDVQFMADEIRKNYGGRTDIILKKVGAYSVSTEAQIRLTTGIEEFRNFVYVADSQIKKDSAKYAASSYMSTYNAKVCDSKEEAYAILMGKTD